MALASSLRKLARPPERGFPWSAPDWPQSVARPAPERKLGVDYDTDWARTPPARFARALLLDNLTRPVANFVASPEVRGAELLELVPPPAIFVANHSSHVDTPILLSVLPKRFRHNTVVAAAADHFFDRRWKAHLWALSLAAIPVERHRVGRRSLELASSLIEDGWNLVIYPEGGRSRDGWFGEFHAAAAYPAARTRRPVFPVHIDGTYRILPPDSKRLRRHQTTVTFGRPLVPEDGEDARRLASRIEEALAVLADEAASDYWSARRRAASGTTPSQHGPDAVPWRRAWALDKAEPGRDEGRWAVRDRPRHATHRTRDLVLKQARTLGDRRRRRSEH